MAEPVDPRIIDMMRQKARTEAPPPKDFEDLMRKVLDADPQSVRLVEESFDLGGLTPQEYATQFLGADAGLGRSGAFMNKVDQENRIILDPYLGSGGSSQTMQNDFSKGRMPTPYLGSGGSSQTIVGDANQLKMSPMFTPSDESQYMKKVFKSLLEAAEEKGKEQE